MHFFSSVQISSHPSDIDFGVDLNLPLGLDVGSSSGNNLHSYLPSCSQSPSESLFSQPLV